MRRSLHWWAKDRLRSISTLVRCRASSWAAPQRKWAEMQAHLLHRFQDLYFSSQLSCLIGKTYLKKSIRANSCRAISAQHAKRHNRWCALLLNSKQRSGFHPLLRKQSIQWWTSQKNGSVPRTWQIRRSWQTWELRSLTSWGYAFQRIRINPAKLKGAPSGKCSRKSPLLFAAAGEGATTDLDGYASGSLTRIDIFKRLRFICILHPGAVFAKDAFYGCC